MDGSPSRRAKAGSSSDGVSSVMPGTPFSCPCRPPCCVRPSGRAAAGPSVSYRRGGGRAGGGRGGGRGGRGGGGGPGGAGGPRPSYPGRGAWDRGRRTER